MKRFSTDQVLRIHQIMIERFGGSPGVREPGLLDSAINSPFQTFDGDPLYPSPIERAAKLAQGIVCNHPFFDGNKRTGVTVMGVYLQAEGLELTATNAELIEFGLHVAQDSNLAYIQEWIKNHVK